MRQETISIDQSLWKITSQEHLSAPGLSNDKHVKLAIVGAGFTGLATAIFAAEAGMQSIVLEEESVGWGASGRNGGQVTACVKIPPDAVVAKFGKDMGEKINRFTANAPNSLFALIKKYSIDCAAQQQGWIQSSSNCRGHAHNQAYFEQWHHRGQEVELLDRKQTSDLLGTDIYTQAFMDYRGGTIQPYDYVIGLAKAAKNLGVEIYGNSPVNKITRLDGGYRLQTSNGTVDCEKLVLATNGYGGMLNAGFSRSLFRFRSIQVASTPLPDHIRCSILPGGQSVADTQPLLKYFRLDPEGRFIMGGPGEALIQGLDKQMEGLRRYATLLYPQLSDIDWQEAWGGFVAVTPDFIPHLSEPSPGLITAGGFGGRGVSFTTPMARVIVNRLSGMPAEELDYPLRPQDPNLVKRLKGITIPLKALAQHWREKAKG